MPRKERGERWGMQTVLSNFGVPDRSDSYRLIVFVMVAIIVLGTAHNFFISSQTGAPALHPLSAIGYLSVALSLLVQPLRPLAPQYWLRVMQLVVITVMAQRLLEAGISTWPRVVTSDLVLSLNERYQFNGQLSVKTAASLLFLHVALFTAPNHFNLAMLFFYGAICVAIFALYQFGFGVFVLDSNFSIASLGALFFAIAGGGRFFHKNKYLRALFSRRAHGAGFRALTLAAVLVPFGGGVLFVKAQPAPSESLFELQLLLSFFSALLVGVILLMGRQINADARQLECAATRDPLTGALSRPGLYSRLPEAGKIGGAVLVDVDHFRVINDRFGYAKGDEILARLGENLQSILSRGELLARWGGEEFLILTPDGREKSLSRLATLIHRAVAAHPPLAIDALRFRVTVSIGYAAVEDDDEGEGDIHRAIGRADAALFAAKRFGRNRTCAAQEAAQIRRATLEELVA